MVQGQKLLIDACVADGNDKRYLAGEWTLDYRRLEIGELDRKDGLILTKQYLDKKATELGTGMRGVHVLLGEFMESIFSSYFNLRHGGDGDGKLVFWGGVGT